MLRDAKGRFVSAKEEPKYDYGFYSKVLKKDFNTLEELKEAEAKVKTEQDEAAKAAEEKKAFAKKVEEAYKNYLAVTKEANEQIAKAHQEYLDVRKEFIDKYKSYHMSYYKDNDKEELSVNDSFNNMVDLFNSLFKF